MTVFLIITAVIIIVSVNYCILIYHITLGLKKLTYSPIDDLSNHFTEHELVKYFVTILVAARNEEQSIGKCLESLIHQDYPIEKYEVIIIDDQSTDRTEELVKEAIASYPEVIRLLSTIGNGGKKEAIHLGLKEAKGDIILTTDADCVVPPTWISKYNYHFRVTDAAYISGPVMMNNDRSFFSTFQALEFNSLIASTAGLTAIGRPVMSNGANMGFALEAFKQVSLLHTANLKTTEEKDIMQKTKASGEDVFTMLSLKQHFGSSKISFLYSPDAIVFTQPHLKVRDFIKQRIRWVSKSNGYKDFDVIYTALSVFSKNFLLVLLPLYLIIQAIFFSTGQTWVYNLISLSAAFVCKLVVDYLLLNIYTRTMGQREIMWYLPLIEPLVIIYTTITGMIGNFLNFEWKGRTYRS